MRKIAIITARGGSKRIPHKNIKEFCGKPIISYSIQVALNSEIFDTVMVSTNDNRIAEIAKAYGAEVPFLRSEATSNDYAVTKDVLREVLFRYEQEGEKFDIACCIYPTAPFLAPDKLKLAVKMLMEKNADSVVPIVKFDFSPLRSFIIEEAHLRYKWPEYMLSRSQDIPPLYHDAGQFYCLRTDQFLSQDSLIMNNTIPLELSRLEVQDIDNQEDWEIAEIKYKILNNYL